MQPFEGQRNKLKSCIPTPPPFQSSLSLEEIHCAYFVSYTLSVLHFKIVQGHLDSQK